MTDFQVEMVLPYTTNLPRDISVMTFAFTSSETDWDVIADDADSWFTTFWATNIGGGGINLSAYMSHGIDRTSCRVDINEITDLGPTSPSTTFRRTRNVVVGAVSGATAWDLPYEVALVGTAVSDVTEVVPIRRRRGRQYLGPFSAVAAATGSGAAAPVTSLMDTYVMALEDLRTNSLADGAQWCVWSRTQGELFQVTRGWVDNEWDTQRRRERDATTRVNWTSGV